MIAERYLARTFLAHAAASTAVLWTLYLVFDLVEVYRFLDEAGGGLTLTLRYLADRSAGALWHVLPGAVLVGLALSLGALARRGELTALYAAGMGPGRLLPPLLLVAALGSGIAWGVAESWMPEANQRIDRLFAAALRRDGAPEAREAWIRVGPHFVHLGEPGPTLDELRQVTLVEMASGFRPARRIDAARMRWRQGRWILEDVTLRAFDPPAAPRHEREVAAPIDLAPERLRAGMGRPDLLPTAEIAELLAWKRREGHDTAALEAALAERRSWPLLPFLFALVAAPVGLRRLRAAGAVVALGRAILIGAAFAAVAFAAQTLARAEVLTPALAGWLPTALLGAVGLSLCARALWPQRPG